MRWLVVTGVMGGLALGNSGVAEAQRWQDATLSCLGTTGEWTNDVELADVDGDGNVDLLAANGGDYASPGSPEPSRVWRNTGDWTATTGTHCADISTQALGGMTGLSRTIRAGDLDGDGDLDVVTGGAYQTQLRLFVRDAGAWTDATARLPQQPTSIGDVEFGDVDGDGDLDMLLAEWGATPPGANNYPGGRTRLYLNAGDATFTDATTTNMPDLLVGWSWDLELVDVDNDFDLDALVTCKLCSTSRLYRNDGTGHFTDDPDALPHFSNNYEFEAMDIDGDGDLDLATLNDGASLRDHLFVNDGAGHFTDESNARLAGAANPTADDNAVVWLDADADGDADLLVASLGTDRLLLNDGSGHFTLSAGATPNDTRGSLAIAVADLDGDGRLDIFQGQGEAAFAEKVQLATDMIAVDTAPPSVTHATLAADGTIVARVHDHQSPSRAHDWQRVWAEVDGGAEVDMRWYGEYLWRTQTAVTAAGTFRVCARDRRGNQACSDMPPVTGDDTVAGDGGPNPTTQPGGCCGVGGSPTPGLVLVALYLIGVRLHLLNQVRRKRAK
ncbi:MAG TPA: VCBS repeat-containing protein [Kofleriaceae bacterium]|nr:VCBS repeat-containing protein [Kofleriaceae bacterium]